MHCSQDNLPSSLPAKTSYGPTRFSLREDFRAAVVEGGEEGNGEGWEVNKREGKGEKVERGFGA